MSNDKLRQRIVFEAARMMYSRQETEYYRAKLKAARKICRGWVRPSELPSNREILHEIQRFTRNSIDGKALERASLAEFEALLWQEAPELDEPLLAAESQVDRFQLYRALLAPLEHVRESRRRHPESDVLYHSLQVYQLASNELPYDEEFLLAALLHDVGKAIDPHEHVQAGLEALDASITERTAWFIENHAQAHALHDGTLGARALRRLHDSDDFELLILLGECDRNGRVPGAQVPDLDDALAEIRELADLYG